MILAASGLLKIDNLPNHCANYSRCAKELCVGAIIYSNARNVPTINPLSRTEPSIIIIKKNTFCPFSDPFPPPPVGSSYACCNLTLS